MLQNIKNIVGNKKLLFIAFLFVLSLVPAVSHAATIYISPSVSTNKVNDTFSASVYVSSPSEAINAVSGQITFPADKIEVLSISKEGSILSFWVGDPSFSNKNGIINFEGVAPNPGFTGRSGKVITFKLKTKNIGTATLAVTQASVLANDGNGTNVLEAVASATYKIVPTLIEPVGPAADVATSPSSERKVPTAPAVSSPTHPNPAVWYQNNSPVFNWKLPSGIKQVRLLISKLPNATPAVLYSGTTVSKTFAGLEDGIWYFHAQANNEYGWGDIAHFKFQIDTKKPSRFDIQEIKRTDLTNPVAIFTFVAYDALSGISHFEVQVDGGPATQWQDDAMHTYATPALTIGRHTLLVKAIDKAGNFVADSVDVEVTALPAPHFTQFPSEITSGDVIVVKGTAQPQVAVQVTLADGKNEPKMQTVNTDMDGNFIYVYSEKTKEGIYALWAETLGENGARSLPSDKIVIASKYPATLRAGLLLVQILSVAVPLVILLMALIVALWYGLKKMRMLKSGIQKDAESAETALHRVVEVLRNDLEEHITMLNEAKEGRPLTKEEGRMYRQMKRDLDLAEQTIEHEIKDIEDKIKA